MLRNTSARAGHMHVGAPGHSSSQKRRGFRIQGEASLPPRPLPPGGAWCGPTRWASRAFMGFMGYLLAFPIGMGPRTGQGMYRGLQRVCPFFQWRRLQFEDN